MTHAAVDWPDLNFIAFHSAYPFEAELAAQAKEAKVKNIYAEMGLLAGIMRQNPQRFAQCMGTLMDGLGPDHILWGTDTPDGPTRQIQGFQTFTIPDEMIEKNRFQQLTPEVKQKIFGGNVARPFNIDMAQVRRYGGRPSFKMRSTNSSHG
jgi:predicted TIM-barrel fold metal-dependent hydrolase